MLFLLLLFFYSFLVVLSALWNDILKDPFYFFPEVVSEGAS